MKRPHTSIQLPSKICILVCLYDGVSHEQMYAVQQEAAMAQVFLWGWALPTSLSCGCFSPVLSLQPCQGHDISNATLNPRETALEQLPSHPSAAEWPAQLPSLLYWQSRMARQENSSSPAQGEIWQAETPEYLRDIINWLVYLHNFFTHFLHPITSLHCLWGERIWDQSRERAKVRAAAWQVHDRKDNLVLALLTLVDCSIFFSSATDQPYPPTSLCAFMFLLRFRWINSMIPVYLVITFSCKQFWL